MNSRTLLLSLAGAAAIGLPFLVSSADNPAQSKAREALRSAAPPPARADVQAQPTLITAQTSSSVTVTRPDSEAQSKARAALREGAAVAPSATTGTPATTAGTPSAMQPQNALASGPKPDTEAQAKAREAVRETTSVPAGFTVQVDMAAAPGMDTEVHAKAREAVRSEAPIATPAATVAEVETPSAAPAQPSTQPTPATVAQPATRRGLMRAAAPDFTAGMVSPESPFTPEQQAALAALLPPYQTDQMSSAEYHRKRAAIIHGS
jgi:hypothetical protein